MEKGKTPSSSSASNTPKKLVRSKCSVEECTNIVFEGSICARHTPKIKCSHEGCTNNAINRGAVCFRHGSNFKRCNYEGCTNQAKKRGFCIRHWEEQEWKEHCSSNNESVSTSIVSNDGDGDCHTVGNHDDSDGTNTKETQQDH